MISSCFTLSDTDLIRGIRGEYFGLLNEDSIEAVDVSALVPGEGGSPLTLGEIGWETLPIYETADAKENHQGCLVLLDLTTWIPCTERRDESFLVDVFQEGLGIVYCPKEATLLRNPRTNILLSVDSSGTPRTDMITSLPSVPKTIEGVYKTEIKVPKIRPKFGLSEPPPKKRIE